LIASETLALQSDPVAIAPGGNPERIGGQVGTGELDGSIIKGEIIIDLNPKMNDANVYLRGTIEGRRFHGKWSFNGYAGPISEGTFEANRK
jgi:hypothetical protein